MSEENAWSSSWIKEEILSQSSANSPAIGDKVAPSMDQQQDITCKLLPVSPPPTKRNLLAQFQEPVTGFTVYQVSGNVALINFNSLIPEPSIYL